MTYTGEALTPEPAVTFNGMTLVKGTDFTYSYQNNTKAALATAENAPTVIVTAQETSTKYSGSATVKFTIKKVQLTVTADNKEVTFGDDAPQYTATITGFVNNETENVLVGTKAFDCVYVKNESVARQLIYRFYMHLHQDFGLARQHGARRACSLHTH